VPIALLIHGFASSAALSWDRTGWRDVLSDIGHTVIAPDLLGHGGADKPHDIEAYAAGVEDGIMAAIEGIDEPVDAVGFSMGGRALLVLAGRHPERFRRLVVGGIGANLFMGGDRSAAEAVAAAIRGEREPVDPISRAFRQAAVTPPNDPIAMAACLLREQPPLDLAAVAHPVTVVAGDADPIAWPADQLVAALPTATLKRLKGVDHLGTMKDFAFLDAAVDAFTA
jgi:pimeloyl-ACP methyl ester carboxylesterase